MKARNNNYEKHSEGMYIQRAQRGVTTTRINPLAVVRVQLGETQLARAYSSAVVVGPI
jgi:hypothetical protein